MYHIKNDQRSIRSAAMLSDGLEKLIYEMPFDTIKVKDLVETSCVGRTTFYRNFDEIEDILRLRCAQVTKEFMSYLHAYRQEHPDESNMAILKPALCYFYSHSELIELLIKAKRVHLFEEAIMAVFEPYRPMFETYFGVEAAYVDYIVAIRISSMMRILTHWVETGKKQTPEALADKLGAIMTDMVALKQFV